MKIKKPYYVDFLVTSKCNLKCSFCSAVASDKKIDDELSIIEIENIFKELDDLEVMRVSIEGGEPFLRKDILDIMEIADQHDFEYYINTNGTLIDKKLAKKISQTNVSKLCISIDGPNKHIHDKSRGVKDSFLKTTKAISYLKNENVNVDAIITISNINKNYIIETLKFLKSIGINNVAIMFLASVGKACENLNDIYLSFNDLKKIIYDLSILKLKNEIPVDLSLVPTSESLCPWEIYLPLKQKGMEDYLSLWKNQNLLSTLSEENFACTAGKDNFTIDASGNVFGCSLMVSMKELKAGNCRNSSLKEIWYNSPIFKKFRNLTLNDITGECKNCNYLYKCKGGCRACAFDLNNSLYASDTRCPLTKGECI
jgi:radical SAM protein with 4Fe4S-binding SPASM domain